MAVDGCVGERFRERDESLVPQKDLMRLDACFQVGFCLSAADPVRSRAPTWTSSIGRCGATSTAPAVTALPSS
jgi:hypothetical protein